MAYVMALAALALCGSLVACGGGAANKSAASGQTSSASSPASGSGTSRAAVAEGRAACKGKSPAQVAGKHLAAARRNSVSSGLAKAGSALADSTSSAKPADAVVASALYAATVGKSIARDAAAGCAAELRASAPAQRAGAPSPKAVTAARRACRSTSPAEVVERFLPLARRRAGTDPLDRRFLKTAATAPRSLRTSPAYPGIAARVYALSLPEPKRQAGLTACATQLITKESK
jgi:hypothetical protein